MEELVILGGGIAGLGCLNALLDHHISPLLLESSTIGSPKMCGEFLAPPVMELLEKWGVGPMQAIKQAQFLSKKNTIQCLFPRKAGAYSRQQAELDLAQRAKQHGGRIVEQSPVKQIIPATASSPFVLHLTSGDSIQARNVIFATGQFALHKKNSMYVGFKTHIPHILQPETLFMFSLQGGYLGVVPVTSDTSNLTCLIKRERVEQAGSCRAFLAQFTEAVQDINLITTTTLNWLEGPAPVFGIKVRPNWPHAYWIGDAFASVHPAIGYGFAHGVTSGLLAAEYYLKQDPTGYHQTLGRLMRPKQIIGYGMHHLLQKPGLCSAVSSLMGTNTRVSQQLLNTLDY